MMGITGPKVSSTMMSIEWSTSTSTVGSNHSPGSSLRRPPVSTLAPLPTASAMWRSTMSSCAGNVIDPMSPRPLASWRILSVSDATPSTKRS